MRFYFALLFYFFLFGMLQGQGTQLLRQPSLSNSHIAFVYANDLWQVDRAVGQAVRLTTNEGSESNPHYSDDGQWIAFTGEYDGNTDVYIIHSAGRSPERLTWHPYGDMVQGWSPDGTVIFRSNRHGVPSIPSTLYEVSTAGGLPTAIPVQRSAYGEYSGDGEYLAYTPIVSWDQE